jgi:demethylmenaquinone methyltransferase/2-methoxy-6-polyprenyl-1,4-benzoquinol methylase
VVDKAIKRDNSLKPNPARIREMFGNITRRYDFFNHLLSFGQDIFWRRALARRLLVLEPPGSFLDLATGSGDQLIMAHKFFPEASLTGLDFSQPMLDVASIKLAKIPAKLVLGDVLEPPLEDNSFDSISMSFGLRNVADRQTLYRQALRLLKPGGRFLVLELFYDPRKLLSPIVGMYTKTISPWIASWLFSAPNDAYKYLGLSVIRFPHPAIIADELANAGFTDLNYRVYTLNVAMLVWGRKPYEDQTSLIQDINPEKPL